MLTLPERRHVRLVVFSVGRGSGGLHDPEMYDQQLLLVSQP